MKLLATLEQKYPAATTATGLVGGFVSWLMHHLPAIERFFSLIGTVAGAAVAVLTLAMKWRAWRAEARMMRAANRCEGGNLSTESAKRFADQVEHGVRQWEHHQTTQDRPETRSKRP